jgi:molybdopterin/thiamine biosynthesis adenylyltransferase
MATTISFEGLAKDKGKNIRFRTTPIPVPSSQKGLKFSQTEIIGEANVKRQENCLVEIIGIGVIGHRVARGLAYKGYPLVLVDDDKIEPHNLLPQQFSKRDVGEYKVMGIGKALLDDLGIANQIVAIPKTFQETVALKYNIGAQIVACQTHNWGSRIEVAYHFYCKTPVVFSGVSALANAAWVFVQEPGGACLRCAFPKVEISNAAPCGGMCGDIADVVVGVVSYAVDTLAIDHPDRKRSWNFYLIDLTGYVPDMQKQITVKRKPNCELCREF